MYISLIFYFALKKLKLLFQLFPIATNASSIANMWVFPSKLSTLFYTVNSLFLLFILSLRWKSDKVCKKKNFFNHADNPSINQSKYLCYRKNQTHIEFKTRGCWEIIQEKKMTCNECFPITVKIDDDVITSSNDTFCYRDDPQIINVSRNTTIMRYF